MSSTPDQNTPPTTAQDPFYVGYLPAPEPHRRSVRLAIILVAVWFVFCAFILVLSARTPGTATWNTSNEMSWTGLLLEEPYPTLITDDDTLLVVSMGKSGAHDQLAGAFGKHITLRGYELQRQGRRMIELVSDSIEPASGTHTPATLNLLDEQPSEFVGEIIDGKCYLGAMKPGDGFAHRACAVLCLRGGLPPMFAESGQSQGRLPLLIIDGKAQIPSEQYHLVATRVRLMARRATLGQLPVLVVDSRSIEQADGFLGMPKSIIVGADSG